MGEGGEKHQECLWYGKVCDVCKEQIVIEFGLSEGSVKEISTK